MGNKTRAGSGATESTGSARDRGGESSRTKRRSKSRTSDRVDSSPRPALSGFRCHCESTGLIEATTRPTSGRGSNEPRRMKGAWAVLSLSASRCSRLSTTSSRNLSSVTERSSSLRHYCSTKPGSVRRPRHLRLCGIVHSSACSCCCALASSRCSFLCASTSLRGTLNEFRRASSSIGRSSTGPRVRHASRVVATSQQHRQRWSSEYKSPRNERCLTYHAIDDD